MKNYFGVYFILTSIVITGIGAVLKIRHNSSADLFLWLGIILCAVGILLLVYTLFIKNSDRI